MQVAVCLWERRGSQKGNCRVINHWYSSGEAPARPGQGGVGGGAGGGTLCPGYQPQAALEGGGGGRKGRRDRALPLVQ